MKQQHFENTEKVKNNVLPPVEVFNDKYADLTHCPIPMQHSSKNPVHMAVGDLHGSAMALIYNLIRLGFLEIKLPGNYTDLLRIYDTNTEDLTEADLELFKDIINDATVHIKNSLTLIGDELGDRGNNDYFTLLVLEKLSKEQLDITILLSNHGVGFLRDHFKPKYTGDSEEVGHPLVFARSLYNMHQLINSNLIQEKEVRQLVNTHYIPMLKAVDYSALPEVNSKEDDFIILYTHAPIDLSLLKEIIETFGIAYHDRTPYQMIDTINQLNFRTASILQNYDSREILFDSILTRNNSALRKLFWQRTFEDPSKIIMQPGLLDADDVKKESEYSILIVHGHNGPEGLVFYDKIGNIMLDDQGKPQTSPNHINVDSNFDKTGIPNCRKSSHIMFRTTGLSSRQLVLLSKTEE